MWNYEMCDTMMINVNVTYIEWMIDDWHDDWHDDGGMFTECLLNIHVHSPELSKLTHPQGKYLARPHPFTNKAFWRPNGARENC